MISINIRPNITPQLFTKSESYSIDFIFSGKLFYELKMFGLNPFADEKPTKGTIIKFKLLISAKEK